MPLQLHTHHYLHTPVCTPPYILLYVYRYIHHLYATIHAAFTPLYATIHHLVDGVGVGGACLLIRGACLRASSPAFLRLQRK